MAAIPREGPLLQIHPLRRCNLECAHCYTMSGSTMREELRVNLLSACLEDAAELGYRQVEFSGGEPLLYAPLYDRLARARALGLSTTITSNGLLISPERWRALADGRLLSLTRSWLAAGRGGSLAETCAATWVELTSARSAPAVHWSAEIGARTRARFSRTRTGQ